MYLWSDLLHNNLLADESIVINVHDVVYKNSRLGHYVFITLTNGHIRLGSYRKGT